MESVYIVSTGAILQGVFKEKDIAYKFAGNFKNAIVEKETLHVEFPKLYRYECIMNLETGKIIEIKECAPSVNHTLLIKNKTILYAVGQTQAEAQYNAEAYFKKHQHIDASICR